MGRGKTGLSAAFDVLGLHLSAAEIVQLLSMEFADAASHLPTKSTLKPGSSILAGPELKDVYNQFDFEPFLYDWHVPVRKRDGSGELLWTTQLGGELQDASFALSTDSTDAVWVGVAAPTEDFSRGSVTITKLAPSPS